jgi:hypothetical protein
MIFGDAEVECIRESAVFHRAAQIEGGICGELPGATRVLVSGRNRRRGNGKYSGCDSRVFWRQSRKRYRLQMFVKSKSPFNDAENSRR